jgi:peptidoglycan/xylan/chitin deacetylase (PgdA/CDA1 family)
VGAALLAHTGTTSPSVRKLFFAVRTLEHLRGARAARLSSTTGRAVVLAYHAIADLSRDAVLAPYGVPPDRFVRQLRALRRGRRHFVDLDDLLRGLRGDDRLPSRAVLITFDDCYADLEPASNLLAERGIPAVAFAVSGQIGRTNEWDRAIGAGRMELLGRDGLAAVAARRVEVGSHSRSHRPLSTVPLEELDDELSGSASEIEDNGLRRPRAFAYPHGDWTPDVADAVRAAGYDVAFTIDPGVAERGVNPHALPRIEVLAGDTPFVVLAKVVTAGWPRGLCRRLFRLLGTSDH